MAQAKKRKTVKKTKRTKILKNQNRFSSGQLLVFVLIFAVVGGAVIWRSLAAPANGNGKTKNAVLPLHLTNEVVKQGLNADAPANCLHEDSYHERDYSGSLSGTLSATDQLCNDELSGGVPWSSGGIGLRAEAWVVGSLSNMAITSPTGVTHSAVLIDSSTSKGVTTNHYQACFCPSYSITYDTGSTPLSMLYSGNPWMYTISGNFSSATYRIYGQMTNVYVQHTWCPASEQNLTP